VTEHPGRKLLAHWRRSKTDNFYLSNPNLERTIAGLAGEAATAGMRDRLASFGATLAAEVDPLVEECERLENLPVLRRWSGIGERTEDIEFHPSYREAGRKVWGAGIIAIQAEPGRALEQAAMIYMLCHLGEGGHACPVACTSGLVKALQVHGDENLRREYLEPLLRTYWEAAHIGAQFLTEVQGGSDVGANVVQARPDTQISGAWRISGEKWFCSVANADQFLMTARVEGAGSGTAGLGCFVVPRRLADGSVNAFALRRLKNKLGTRTMASAEIDFNGALAWPIGPLRDGFKIAAGLVLNTSRWINALGSTGVMRRAYLEAVSYAAAREAFGGPIGRYPLVRETLARMKAEEMAGLSSTLFLSRLIDRLEGHSADKHEQALYRFLVNANKYITSIAASEVAHGALEILGGNGAIEDFSCVPRLLRDNLVFESWEGAHNVLVMQVLRDSAKYGLFANIHDEITGTLEGLDDPQLRAEAPALVEGLADLSNRAARSQTDPRYGATHFRRQLGRTMRLFQVARLLAEADAERRSGIDSGKGAAAALLARVHLAPAYQPDADPDWLARIDAVLGTDLPAA
jgi:acyl-CoA dehydrogenase